MGLAASGLEKVELPQGAYRAAAGVSTIGVSNLLVCRPDLPAETAEALTRLLVRRACAFVPEGAVGTGDTGAPAGKIRSRRRHPLGDLREPH